MSPAGAPLSRFTPSLMSHELLERLFVARERTLNAIMKRIDAAATSEERNHTLLVGPRGAGKTHVVSLVYHRVNERRSNGTRIQVAWLPEDPWTIASYRHLLLAIAEKLEPKSDEELPSTADHLEHFLTDRATNGGPIVVVVENLDQILSGIGAKGQQQLRHFLQTDRSLLLVATSTRLDRALSDQASPFYGFFTTTRLEPFNVDEAAAMLTAVARERDDQKLADYLKTDDGRARLRTIAHLAGGQPRMWAALASALTVEGLDDLIDLLLTRFDDLTPYYQEQLGRLSPQQRLVVAELAEIDRPINVKELAERLALDQRSLAKTMVELMDRGWASQTRSPIVAAYVDKRRTYYELAEPMARLSFQIKEARGEPLRLVVDFLKHWFDPAELSRPDHPQIAAEYLLLAADGHDRDPVVAVTRTLYGLPTTRAPAVALLGEVDDALAALAHDDPEPFLRLPMPVRAALEGRLDGVEPASVRLDIHRHAHMELGHYRHPTMDQWIDRASRLVGITRHGTSAHAAQLILTDWLARAWRFDEAEEALAAAMTRMGSHNRETLRTRESVSVSYLAAEQGDHAVRFEEAVLMDCERVLGADHIDTLRARHNLAITYCQARRFSEAIQLAQHVLADSERLLGVDDGDTLRARHNLAVAYREAGHLDEAIDLTEHVLAASERLLGDDHPNTLGTRSSLAVSYWQTGRFDEALNLQQAVLADRERTRGRDHRESLESRITLSVISWSSGRRAAGLRLAESAAADCERVLGPDHPHTIGARENLASILQAMVTADER